MHLRPRKLFTFVFASFLGVVSALVPTRAYALADFLQPAEIGEFFTRQFAKQDLNSSITLLNLEIVNGVTAALKYRYEAEPSYIDGYFNRYDTYSVEDTVSPSAWVTGMDGPFSLGLSTGTNIIFVRQFKSQEEAITASPYSPKSLPISTDRVLNKLSIGDFVSFQTHINLLVSLEKKIPAFGAVELDGATHAMISGEFLVHIFKVDADHVRIKLISIHDAGVGTSLGLQVSDGITLIALTIKDHELRKAWNVDLGSFSQDVNLTDLYMVDYILNLRDPRVSKAYDELMQKKAILKSLEMFYPETKKTSLGRLLLTDFNDLEKLYGEEKNKPKKDRVVDRLFKGSTTVATEKTGFNFNITFLRFNYQSFFAQNHISTTDTNDQPLYYLFDTFSSAHNRRMPFHFWDRSDQTNSNLLFSSTSKYEPETFVGLFLNREIQTQSLSESDLKEIRADLKNTLPESIYSQIPLNEWNPTRHEGVNAYFKHEIYFPVEALKAMPVLNANALKRRYQTYLNTLGKLKVYPSKRPDPFPENDNGGALPYHDPNETQAERFDYDLEIITQQISIAFNPKIDVSVRHDAFIKLKNNDLFVETGAGFLIYLLPQDKLDKLLGYSLILTGKDMRRIDFSFGEPTQSDLYHSMLYIQDLLNARTVDLHLLQDVKEINSASKQPSEVP